MITMVIEIMSSPTLGAPGIAITVIANVTGIAMATDRSAHKDRARLVSRMLHPNHLHLIPRATLRSNEKALSLDHEPSSSAPFSCLLLYERNVERVRVCASSASILRTFNCGDNREHEEHD